jgi:hypothetical protein
MAKIICSIIAYHIGCTAGYAGCGGSDACSGIEKKSIAIGES